MERLTFMNDSPQVHESTQAEVGDTSAESQGHPQFFLAGFVVLLAVLWLVRNKSESLQREVLGINLFNLLMIGLTAVLFIAMGKVVTARFPIPGLTPLFASL